MDHNTIAILGTLAIVLPIALPVVLIYRYFVLRMNRINGKEMDKILAKFEALEKRCAKMEDQIVDLHLLLEDEQRKLDKKLDAILPDTPQSQPPAETSEATSQKHLRQRVR